MLKSSMRVMYPVQERYPMQVGITAIGLHDLAPKLRSQPIASIA
jgi:hypothetical protein